MKPALLDTLVSPAGNPLHYDITTQRLEDQTTGEFFEVVEHVPVLLPANAGERWMEVTLSNGVIAKFYYVDHYQQDAEVFDYFEAMQGGAAQHENRRLQEMILSEIPGDAKKILDVGCGSAWLAAHFVNKERKVAVYSMDVSLENPTRALKKYAFERHFAVVADVYALPFRENTFDCIVAAEVMEHTPDPKLFITSLLRILKPNGTLIITTPFNERISYSLCVHCNRPTPHNAHLHSFTEQKIGELLAGQAMQNWKTITFANKALVKLQMHRLLQHFSLNTWKVIDKWANLLYNKPLRLLIKVTK